jgi:uncharacterized protein (DUF779 family)
MVTGDLFRELGKHQLTDIVYISKFDYDAWKHSVIFDNIRGLRFGQSFCNQFNITDNLLHYTSDIEWCDEYINETYVQPNSLSC